MKFKPQRLDTLPHGRVERSSSGVGGRTDVVPPAAENPWSRSLWLEGVVEDLTPREPLSGDHTCDVAIVGAGFGGLWTAYYLKAADPSLRVTVIEAEIAGFGAAGRNGGFVSAWHCRQRRRATHASADGTASCGPSARPSTGSTRSAGSSRLEGIDCGYKKGGALTCGDHRSAGATPPCQGRGEAPFWAWPERHQAADRRGVCRPGPRSRGCSRRVLQPALCSGRPRPAGSRARRRLRAPRCQDLRADARQQQLGPRAWCGAATAGSRPTS